MIDSPLRKYYEENIQKGYTIDQITNNLRSNGYSEDDLKKAAASLSAEYLELSRRNPSLFDYSSLPQDVKTSIGAAPQTQSPSGGGNGVNLQSSAAPQGAARGSASQQPGKMPQKPGPDEIHPGMDTQAKIKFGVVLGLIFMVIMLGSILLSTSSNGSDDAINGDPGAGTGDAGEAASPGDGTDDVEDPSMDDTGLDDWNDFDDDDDDDDETTQTAAQSTTMLIAEAEEAGMDISEDGCTDYECLAQSAEMCEGSANMLVEDRIRPFSVIQFKSFELIESGEECILFFRLEGYRRRYMDDEVQLMMDDEGLEAHEISAEEEDMWVQDAEHSPDDYAMVCRTDEPQSFYELFSSYSDGDSHSISCPPDASTGMIFDDVSGIRIGSGGTRACQGEGLWENLECVRFDPSSEIERQFDDVGDVEDDDAEEYGDLEDFESDFSGYRDTRGDPCETDDECFDGDVMTINYCEEGACRVMLDDGRECVSGDNFCPERCYGENITDCKDPEGNRLCSEDAHCEDDDEYTEALCRDGTCVFFDVEPPNKPPVIDSHPTEHAVHGERYNYTVEAHDPDGGNVTFSLQDEPEGMTINSTTGELVWDADISDYSSGVFSIVVSDGVDETKKELFIFVYLQKEDNEMYKGNEDRGSFRNLISFENDHKMCKYLKLYWDDTMDDVYECIMDIASNAEDESICDFIYDDDAREECLDIV